MDGTNTLIAQIVVIRRNGTDGPVFPVTVDREKVGFGR